jgi:hypothetical protein
MPESPLLPDPHADPVVVSNPPVLACTQLPEVNPLSVRLANVAPPVVLTVAFVPFRSNRLPVVLAAMVA